jgi:hypothetical protein
MLPYLRRREFAAFPSKCKNSPNVIHKRNIRIDNIQGFQFWLGRLGAFCTKMHNYNFYYSMAVFKDGLPKTHPRFMKLQDDAWNKSAYAKIYAYDMLIDVDADFEDLEYARESAMAILKMFDRLYVPYHLIFSGRGFHIKIPYSYFDNYKEHFKGMFDPAAENNIYMLMSKIASYLHDEYSEMVDKDIYDSRRVCKIPYSLAIYDEGAFVCAPIEDIDGFDIEDYRLGKYIKQYDDIYNAGGSIKKLIEKVV